MLSLQSFITGTTVMVAAVSAQNLPVGEHNYSSQAQPDLTNQTVETITLSFPDCSSGPLSQYTICNTSASYMDRATSLISLFTLEELINQTGNTAPGVPRLGLPDYQVWNEALHGLDRANFSMSGDYQWATSFPMPILSMASMNRTLINQIGTLISTQARAFSNAGKYGLDSYAPNINAFRSPLWGRGQETPGEDLFVVSQYAYEYITGMQGGVEPEHLKIVATAKHFAGYDLENYNNVSRLGYDAQITQQDLAEFYTPQFLTAARDAKVNSVMCSYNAVNGVPSCANSFFLQTLLRNTWTFDTTEGYVSTDCDAAYNIYDPHMYASNQSIAAADSVRAGADIDCGTTYQYHLNESITAGEITRQEIEQGVIRLYSNLVRLGYFDGNSSEYRQLTWNDVLSSDAQNISYEAAVEGITLLKNDGTLPLSSSTKSIALIGPWANATVQMQGNYFGTPPYLLSPLAAAQASNLTVNYAFGTNISMNSTEYFAGALAAANMSDVIVFAGGIDNTVEAEGSDRMNITWPGNQLDLIAQLSTLGKPVVVLQMGGGQIDSSSLKSNPNVNSLVWGGYPGQSGGQAILDILTGARAPAGRLITTQYPADYVDQFSQSDMSLRPNGSNPGQTYKWYTGSPVYEFGTGLFYTNFSISASFSNTSTTFNTSDLISAAHPGYAYTDLVPFFNYTVIVTNTGTTPSDYTATLFANTSTSGPSPYPNKWVVGFERLPSIAPGASATLTIPVSVGSMARYAESGDAILYPGMFELALNNERDAVLQVTLTGDEMVLIHWPKGEQQVLPS
ncbi:xylan 1,4-beta-xylosidase, partial [Lecanoromycetidae sp. Uapishka_2]